MSGALFVAPSLMVKRVADIPFTALAAWGYHHYLFDLDNTLAAPGASEIDPAARKAILAAQERGDIQGLAVVSNVVLPVAAWTNRVRLAADQLGSQHFVAAVWPRLKPHPDPFEQGVALLGSLPSQTVMVGDQIGKDMAAHWVGLYTILVEPIGLDPWFRQGKRRYEARVRARWWENGRIPTTVLPP